MKKCFLLFLLLVPVFILFGQDIPVEEGAVLTTGKNATLGLEASTAFAWDLDNNTTGLETKVGMDLVFPLFPAADRGIVTENFDDPVVRIVLKNSAFTWWNTYSASGGNYAQDDFNDWNARPLVLTYDDFFADVIWKNYFLRIASSTTVMRTNQVSLFSIFDDVMDVNDRFYYDIGSTRALWHTERYNIQQLPLLKEKIERDMLDVDYRSNISGILAAGVEFDFFSAIVKAASFQNGKENVDNAWLIGLDAEILPFNNFLISLTGFYGFNYEKILEGLDPDNLGINPVNFGVSLEYRMPFSDTMILTPKLGFDFSGDTISGDNRWELGAGAVLYTRGYDLTSSRILDWANVIPVGASLSAGYSSESVFNAMLSWFEPAGRNSLIPYFGGFVQLELANLMEANDSTYAFAFLGQLEYMIAEKFTPYIRGGYIPEFMVDDTSKITGSYLVKAALGIYFTPVNFFSMDVRYETDLMLLGEGGTKTGKSLFSTVFTIRM